MCLETGKASKVIHHASHTLLEMGPSKDNYNWEKKAGSGRKGIFQPAHLNQKSQEAHWDTVKFPFRPEIGSV